MALVSQELLLTSDTQSEKLRQDGNLRSDMEFPEYDENGEAIIREGEVAPRLYKGGELVTAIASTVPPVTAPVKSEEKKVSVVEKVKEEIESKK